MQGRDPKARPAEAEVIPIHADNAPRLDELAALLPDAGIRRRSWWQGRPALDPPALDDQDEDDYLDEGQDEEDVDADEPPAGGYPGSRLWEDSALGSEPLLPDQGPAPQAYR